MILKSIFDKARVKYNDRYGDFLDQEATIEYEKLYEDSLDVVVREVFFSLKVIGQDTASSNDTELYMHIISSQAQPDRFGLYIGQTNNMSIRVGDHKTNRRKSGHGSLHYSLWNSLKNEVSSFVTLCDARSLNEESNQLHLNMLEMWTYCVFQILAPKIFIYIRTIYHQILTDFGEVGI